MQSNYRDRMYIIGCLEIGGEVGQGREGKGF